MIPARLLRALSRLTRSEHDALRLGLAIALLVGAAYLAIGFHYRPGGGVAGELRDTYLYYQYAASLAQGHPYEFQPGDGASTGSTSHLYPAVLGAFHALGARGDALSVAGAGLSLASLLVCIALVWAIARRVAPESLALVVVLAATSGHLAISLFDQTDATLAVPLALGAFAALLYRRIGWLRVALVLLPFARPDGVVVALALLAATRLWRARPEGERRALAVSAWLGVAAFAATLALDLALTGDALPHSALAKGLFHDYPPAGALFLAAQVAAKLFAELVLGLGDGPRRLYLLPVVGGALALAGLFVRSRESELFDRVFPLAALGLVAVGILSGGSGVHRDRYLAWALPLALVYVGVGARAASRWTRQPRLFGWLAVALIGFQGVGAVYMAAGFAAGCVETASSVRFAKQLDARLPEGSRLGVASGAGLAYFMPRLHVTHVNGITSPAFARPEPNVMGVEILRRRPELRFDYWLLRPSAVRSGWFQPFLGAALAGEAPELGGDDAQVLFESDWSALEAAAVGAARGPALARLEVGAAASEAEHAYRSWARAPGARIEPVLVTGQLGGQPAADVGRIIRGGEAFRIPTPPSGGLVVTLRTAARADGLVRNAMRVRPQRFHHDTPLALVVRIEGQRVATPSLPLDRDPAQIQEHTFDVTVPRELRGRDTIELAIEGDYLSLGYAFHDAVGAAPPAARAPRMLLIVVDTLRRDALGCYGRAGDPTPAIDALARDGTRFEHAISSSGWTLPAMGSLLTGTWPAVHKAVGKRTRLTPISRDVTTGSEVLQAAGFRTLAVANAAFVSPHLGLARGFDVFDHHPAFNREIRDADASVDRALALLDEHGDGSFFLLLHLFDPHLDYDPPADFARRFAGAAREPAPPLSRRDALALGGDDADPDDLTYLRGLYLAEVASVDRAIGRLLGALRERGLYDGTLVALTSDHGEEFWEHGGFEHGHTLHDELVRVPLVVKLPGRAGQRPVVEAQVRVLDVLPTAFELFDVEPPDSFVGTSLAPLISGRDDTSRLAYSESTLYGAEKRALRGERFSYLVDARGDAAVPEALYDRRADPLETTNLIDARPAEAQRMRERLGAFVRTLERDASRTRPGPALDVAPGQLEQLEEQLRSLGYLEGTGRSPTPPPGS